jgi:hypothetical protein
VEFDAVTSSTSPIAIRITWIALPIRSAAHFSPFKASGHSEIRSHRLCGLPFLQSRRPYSPFLGSASEFASLTVEHDTVTTLPILSRRLTVTGNSAIRHYRPAMSIRLYEADEAGTKADLGERCRQKMRLLLTNTIAHRHRDFRPSRPGLNPWPRPLGRSAAF